MQVRRNRPATAAHELATRATMVSIDPPAGGFRGPVKRSVTIAGHETSVSLEPVFWRALERAAAAHGLPLGALVAAIDALRVRDAEPANLASALRCWLLVEGEAARDR